MGFEARDKYQTFVEWNKNWRSGKPCPVCGAVAYGTDPNKTPRGKVQIGNIMSLHHKEYNCGQRWKYAAELEAKEAAKNVIRNHRIWIRRANG